MATSKLTNGQPPSRSIEVDSPERRVSYPDEKGYRIDVEFPEHHGVDMFLVVCAVGILQDAAHRAGRAEAWRGATIGFLRKLCSKLGRPVKSGTLLTYWSECSSGSKAKHGLTQVFMTVEGKREEAGRARELFRQADGLMLGPESYSDDGTRTLWSITLIPGRKQEDVESFERLKALVLGLAEEMGEATNVPQRIKVRQEAGTAEAGEDLRRRLRKKAEEALKNALRANSTDVYVELKLSMGRFPTREEAEAADDAFGQKPLEMGRIWGPFSTSLLMPPRENYFLSSVSGAGKTTFLRHLQFEMLKSSNVLPVYIQARDLVRKRRVTWPFVRRLILESPDFERTPRAARRVLADARRNGSLILLVDCLDNLGKIGMNCSRLVDDILGLSVGSPVVMAGRPSAARWIEDRRDAVLLRLEQFDDPACRAFFGESYDPAREICQHSWELMGTPMLAYMVRMLIEAGKDKAIACRWDLYSQFVQHILNKHPANRQRDHHDKWTKDVLDGLAMVSYCAIDRKQFSLAVISSRVLRGIAADLKQDLDLDLLRSAGLAEVVDVSPDPFGPSLAFTHQSFQEYLAAEWASRTEERTSHLLDEYWAPKWREVIKFLAGTEEGEKIVKQIYPGPESDNAIHSRLFLAAELALHVPRGSALRVQILRDLMMGPLGPLLGRWRLSDDGLSVTFPARSPALDSYASKVWQPCFPEALRCLVSLALAHSPALCWQVVLQMGRWEALLVESIDPGLVVGLYSKEHLGWLLNCLGRGRRHAVPRRAVSAQNRNTGRALMGLLLESWMPVLPEECIAGLERNLYKSSYAPFLDKDELLEAFAQRLCDDQVHKAVQTLTRRLSDAQEPRTSRVFPDEPDRVNERMTAVVGGLGGRLSSEEVSQLIALMDWSRSREPGCHWLKSEYPVRCNHRCIWPTFFLKHMLQSLCWSFGEEHRDALLTLWSQVQCWYIREEIVPVVVRTADKFSKQQVQRIAQYLDDPDYDVKREAAIIIGNAVHGVAPESRAALLDLYDQSPECALNAIGRLWTTLTAEQQARVHRLLGVGEMALKAAMSLKDQLNGQEIDAIVKECFLSDDYTQGRCWPVAHRLDSAQFAKVLEGTAAGSALRFQSRPGQFKATGAENTAKRFAPYSRPEHCELVMRILDEHEGVADPGQLLFMIAPEHFKSWHVAKLLSWLEVKQPAFRSSVYRVLKELHDQGVWKDDQ